MDNFYQKFSGGILGLFAGMSLMSFFEAATWIVTSTFNLIFSEAKKIEHSNLT
jgi:hypothetical protein